MRRLTIAALFVLLTAPLIHAQQELFKSLFIYNFTKNIEWPDEYKSGDFIITVIGQDGLTGELQKLAQTKKVNAQPIVVKQLTTVAGASKTNIVYVSSSKSSNLATVVDTYKDTPTLIISDQGGGCKTGSGINFVIVDGKIKFEISPGNITSSGLQLSPKLTSLGITVE